MTMGDNYKNTSPVSGRFTNGRNFLATDKVPPTIFGIPVVTRREDYTEADIRFFSEHPEAGGYYSMGDEDETPEDGSQGALGGGLTVASIFGPEGLDNLVKAGRKDLPRLAQASTGPDGSGIEFSIGEMKDVRLRKGWEQALLRKKKSLGDLLDFSSPQGQRMLTAYPGLDRIRVTNEPRDGVTDFGRHSKSGEDEYIWINPNHSSYRNKDVGELYDTILHEGINHAIFAREPSFPQRERPYEDLTDFGYAIDLEESIVDLASSRGAKRAMSGRGSADSREFAAKINPHRFARGQAALSAGAEPVIYKSTAASENPGDRSEEALPARKGGK